MFSVIRKKLIQNYKINFMTIASCTKAAIQYSGYSNKHIEDKKIQELKNILEKENIKHDNNFELLVYNSPFEILKRRNEITERRKGFFF